MGTVYLQAVGTKLRLPNDNIVISNESGIKISWDLVCCEETGKYIRIQTPVIRVFMSLA